MTCEEWCDVAWEYLLDSTPMMANPAEYRDALWSAIHDGEVSPEMKKRQLERAPERARAALGKAPPTSALSELEALQQRAIALREAKNT